LHFNLLFFLCSKKNKRNGYGQLQMDEKKKRNNATITFSDKAQKEKLLLQLNSMQLQNLMPESARGKDCQKVIWAVDYLYNLAIKGKIRVQVPMFEEDSQEKFLLIEEIQRLKYRIAELERQEGKYIDTINNLMK